MWAEERNKKRQIGTNSQTSLQSNLGSHPHHNGTDKELHTTGERHRGAESAKQTLEPDPVSTGVGSRISSQCPRPHRGRGHSPSNDGRTTNVAERKPRLPGIYSGTRTGRSEEAEPALASQRNRYRRSHRSSLRRHLLDLGHRSRPRRQNRTRSSTRIPPHRRRRMAARRYPRRPAHPQARCRTLRRNRRSVHLRTFHRRRVERRNPNRRLLPGRRR